MKVPVWAAELAGDFWALVGEEEPFPRKLRGPIRALPVSIEEIAGLTTASAFRWLERNGIAPPSDIPDRALRGCLMARDGHAVLFVDAADVEDEKCFTLAHELAHFLRDYRRPRERAAQRLGAPTLEVFDGKRLPTAQERLGALLTGAPLGLHMHLMHRDPHRRPVDSRSIDAEVRADQLAWELLAPAAHVAAHRSNSGGREQKKVLEERLCRFYGLPSVQARLYADELLGKPVRVEPWLAALRNSLQA